MIKYAFLLEEKYKKPLADKPKRNAKAFQKSMGKIVKTILDSQKTLEQGNLLNVMLNKDLKLCSARFEENDFIYNIVVKEFPGPSNRFFMKILKEIYQARKQSGMNKQNFGKQQRAFEIELKKVIKKFNESEIQYKYFMKKIQIEEEQKKSRMLELQNKLKTEENLRVQSIQQEPDLPVNSLPRKTKIISQIEGLEEAGKMPMTAPRKTVIISEIDKLEKPTQEEAKVEEVVTIQTGNQSSEEEKEIETNRPNYRSKVEQEQINKNAGLIVDQIDQLEKQTLGVDSGSHYIVRKTRMLEQQQLSELAKMQILPEENTESENSVFSSQINESNVSTNKKDEDSLMEQKPKTSVETENENVYQIRNIKFNSSEEYTTMNTINSNPQTRKDSKIHLSTEKNQKTNKHATPRMTTQFYNDLPELNQSTVITIDLKESDFIDKELYEFADYVDEDGDGVDDRKSNLEKKCFGFIWWNRNKSASDNISLNIRKNPYFRALLLLVFIISLIALVGLTIAISLKKQAAKAKHDDSGSQRVASSAISLLRNLNIK